MFNINNLARQALSCLYPNQELIFTNQTIKWNVNFRNPIKLVNKITLLGRLQPVDPATIQQLGFNINEYEYYRVYISDITPTQADRVRELGTSEFIYNNYIYHIVGKLPYDTNGWRELYCYLVDKVEEIPQNYFGFTTYEDKTPDNTVGYALYVDNYPTGEGKYKTYNDE